MTALRISLLYREDSEEARFEKRRAMSAQRLEDYKNGAYALGGGVADPMPEDAPWKPYNEALLRFRP